MSADSVLVVIPTYQEASNIETVISQVRASYPPATIFVVDDNSPDGTADLAEKMAEKVGKVEVLRRPGKAGLGSAYRAGFAWGLEQGFDILVEMDADLSHDPAALPSLITAVSDGADLVIGSRYVPGGAIPGWPVHRLVLSRCANLYAGAVLGTKISDATAGYRAYRASALRKLDLNDVHADGYGFQIEMAYRMFRMGAVIREVPITFIDRVQGVSKMSSRIIVEAFALVAFWGLRDRVFGRLRKRRHA